MPHPLEAGTIYLLRARLSALPLSFDEFIQATTPEEHARAARFLHDQDRRRHLVGRGLLRSFLAPRLGTTPTKLDIRATALGKPFIVDGPSFNISHSGDVVLVAIAGRGRVGADVEAIRPITDIVRLSRTTFAPDEIASILRFEDEARLRPFFRTWARKEAILKALGLGLTALADISVSCEPDTPNALLRLDRPDEAHQDWSIRPVACGEDVEAAVAWDHPIRDIRMYDRLPSL